MHLPMASVRFRLPPGSHHVPPHQVNDHGWCVLLSACSIRTLLREGFVGMEFRRWLYVPDTQLAGRVVSAQPESVASSSIASNWTDPNPPAVVKSFTPRGGMCERLKQAVLKTA